MVEKSLHQVEAAREDLDKFQTLSRTAPANSYLFEDLFNYLDRRAQLSGSARDQMDVATLEEENRNHPDQPEILYLLASAQLKSGDVAAGKSTIEQLDKLSAADVRTLTGAGVLLARYHLYDDAIRHFQSALTLGPGTDDIEFDLADACFRKGLYQQALESMQRISEPGRADNAYLALLGDIYAHLGDLSHAEEIYRSAITRNPDNDEDYLSLALLDLRRNNTSGAQQTLTKGQARVPDSGKILWGLGLVSAMQGKTADAAAQFEQAVTMLPEWPGSYSTLGVFYFESGQVEKAREVLDRFKNSSARSGLDIDKIEQALSQAPSSAAADAPLSPADRTRLLQLALVLADRTL
jgi:tetratricopeptide (TPR) repeat protein